MEDVPAYNSRHLKKLLKKHYGSHILFSQEQGKATLIYFVDMAKFIINSNTKKGLVGTENESETILKKAALLIKTEIRDMTINKEYYPSSNDVKNNWIPEKLKMFLSFFTKSELQQESIGQTIVKVSAPNQIPPILFALSVEMDNLFGSRWLIDELFKLGFGVSYSEVIRFKQACVINESSVLELLPTSNSQGFTQFVADNVDHNIATLNGEGTFHGMGILSATVSLMCCQNL